VSTEKNIAKKQAKQRETNKIGNEGGNHGSAWFYAGGEAVRKDAVWKAEENNIEHSPRRGVGRGFSRKLS